MTQNAAFVMYAVAAVAALAGAVVVGRRAADEAAVYRHRIAGTMLLALAAILAAFATAARTMAARDQGGPHEPQGVTDWAVPSTSARR